MLIMLSISPNARERPIVQFVVSDASLDALFACSTYEICELVYRDDVENFQSFDEIKYYNIVHAILQLGAMQ